VIATVKITSLAIDCVLIAIKQNASPKGALQLIGSAISAAAFPIIPIGLNLRQQLLQPFIIIHRDRLPMSLEQQCNRTV
jgi:hypothetical protein